MIILKTYKLHLIRHALCEGISEGKYIGHTDAPLSTEGKEQLADMAEKYEYPEASVVISSPLARCLETAKILYPGMNPIIINMLAECDFGEFEGLTAEELAEVSEFGAWLAGGADAAPPHGESGNEFQSRVFAAFVRIIDGIITAGTDNAAVITHGGVINTMLALFAFPEKKVHEWLIPCCCGYTISITPSVWSQLRKVEVFADIPLIPLSEENDEGDAEYDDIPFDKNDFIGFYSAENE